LWKWTRIGIFPTTQRLPLIFSIPVIVIVTAIATINQMLEMREKGILTIQGADPLDELPKHHQNLVVITK